jgi:predicted nucleotidyltransferase
VALLLKLENIESLLIENLNHIKKFGISRLGIFGSYSKGHPTETSDIDIVISFEPHKKTFDNYIDLKFYLEELLNKRIDLVIEENIKKELRDEILRSVHYVKAA